MITPVSMFCLLSLEKWSDHRADKPDEKPNRHNRALRCQPIKKPPFVYTMIASIIV